MSQSSNPKNAKSPAAGLPTKPAPPAAADKSAEKPIIQLRHILTPIDFSEASLKALKYAVAFANQYGSTLLLIHVVEFSAVGSEFGAIEISRVIEEMQDNASKQLKELAKQVATDRVRTEIVVQSGRPYSQIIDVAKEKKTDLIIIASHGHSSLAHVLLGSTVERVVRQGPCPVLVIRPEEHEFV